MEQRSDVASCEICGTGLCAEAQPDGVPCIGTKVLCTECAKGRATEVYRSIKEAASPEDDLLERAGL